MIVIIDYHMGNVGSIENMLKRIGVTCKVSNKKDDIEKAKKIILPGVGAFDEGIKKLNELYINDLIINKVQIEKVPILGICLGMQLFTKKSEEGILKGLSFIDAETVKFKFINDYKIPHMGWNEVNLVKENKLFNNLKKNRFYFVHSYHVVCKSMEDILSLTHYGNDFISSIHKENIYGVQFHPEKSHKFGMELLKNFAKLC